MSVRLAVVLCVALVVVTPVVYAGMDARNQARLYESMLEENKYTGKTLPLTREEEAMVAKASKVEQDGWVYVNVSGSPYERGFQNGYSMAKEYGAALQTYQYITLQNTGMPFSFFAAKAIEFHKKLIPEEYMTEMQGMADGFTKGGTPTTLEDVVGWNSFMGLSGYWWPTVVNQYASNGGDGARFSTAHCSAFIATGSATSDGKIVMGHETFIEFWGGQYMNVILSIKPDNGYDIIMQTGPGYLSSMTDFWINSAGLMITETTLAGAFGYKEDAMPEYIRARNATQYSSTIKEWIDSMNESNNGGYANSWLLGDIKTNEIAEFEQGLNYQYVNVLQDGYIFGDNVANSPEVRNLECRDTGYSDVRQQTGARRTRWPQLLEGHYGNITAEVGQTMLADTYDPYLKKENPSSRCICSHYDADPQYYVSDPNAVWNVPFQPAGSVDGKVTTSDMAKEMTMSARFGRADGVEFDAESFFAEHSQWAWQAPVVISRPSQPWSTFRL